MLQWVTAVLYRHAKDKHQEEKEFKLKEETSREKEKGTINSPAINLRLRSQRSWLTTTAAQPAV